MRFKKIPVVANELGCVVITMSVEELGGANQGCDVDSQRRWRVAACFLRAILRGHRPFTKQETGGTSNHIVGSEVPQRIVLPQTPSQQYWKCNLVQLNTPPVWSTVKPEVLIEPAVFALRRRTSQCLMQDKMARPNRS